MLNIFFLLFLIWKQLFSGFHSCKPKFWNAWSFNVHYTLSFFSPSTKYFFKVPGIPKQAFVICDGLDLCTLSCTHLYCESLSEVFLKYLSDHTLHLHNPFLISPFLLPLSLSQLFMVWLELPLWSQLLQCVHHSWILAQSTVVGMVVSFPTCYNCQPYYFFAHWMTFTAKPKYVLSQYLT